MTNSPSLKVFQSTTYDKEFDVFILCIRIMTGKLSPTVVKSTLRTSIPDVLIKVGKAGKSRYYLKAKSDREDLVEAVAVLNGGVLSVPIGLYLRWIESMEVLYKPQWGTNSFTDIFRPVHCKPFFGKVDDVDEPTLTHYLKQHHPPITTIEPFGGINLLFEIFIKILKLADEATGTITEPWVTYHPTVGWCYAPPYTHWREDSVSSAVSVLNGCSLSSKLKGHVVHADLDLWLSYLPPNVRDACNHLFLASDEFKRPIKIPELTTRLLIDIHGLKKLTRVQTSLDTLHLGFTISGEGPNKDKIIPLIKLTMGDVVRYHFIKSMRDGNEIHKLTFSEIIKLEGTALSKFEFDSVVTAAKVRITMTLDLDPISGTISLIEQNVKLLSINSVDEVPSLSEYPYRHYPKEIEIVGYSITASA